MGSPLEYTPSPLRHTPSPLGHSPNWHPEAGSLVTLGLDAANPGNVSD